MYVLLGWRRIVIKEFQALTENFYIPSKKLELLLIKKILILRILMKFFNLDIINTKNLYYSTFPSIMEEANSKI